MVNHTMLLLNRLDAQPVLSLVKLIALLRNKYKDYQVENRKIPLLESRGVGGGGWIEMPASRRIEIMRQPAG